MSMISGALSSQGSDMLYVELSVFNTFAFLGLFLNAGVLAPALWSSRIRRRSGWFSLIISWMIYSITYLMIVGHQTGPAPPFGRCLAQAVLIYAIPPMCALSHTCLVIDYYILASALTFGKKVPNRLVFRTLLAIPWIACGLLIYITILLIGDPSTVIRNGNHFYCFVQNNTPFMVSAITIFVAFVVIVAVKIHTTIILRRHWGAFKMSLTADKTYLSLSTFVRMSLFTALSFLAAGLDMTAVYRLGDNTAGWAITLIVMPTLAALVFGTQKDILSAWMFWAKKGPDDSSADPFQSKAGGKISRKTFRRMSIH